MRPVKNEDRGTNPRPQVITMQIIAGALIVGVVTFAAITLFLGAWNEPEMEGPLKYLGVVVAVATLVPFVLVPSLITLERVQKTLSGQGQRPEDQTGVLLGVYQTRMIVRLALLEGAAFLNLIAFLGEHAQWSLGVVAALVTAMLAIFPTRGGVESWVEAERMRSGGDIEHSA